MPVIELGKTRTKSSSNQSSLCGVVRFLVALFLILYGTLLCAQTLEIRLVDGRNGCPMADHWRKGDPVADHCVNVWVGTARKEAICIPTDANGVARLRLTDNIGEIDIQNRSKHGGSIVAINPVLKYEDSLAIQVGYALCIPRGSHYSWLAVSHFSTKQLLQQGYVSPNTCGKATASPKPGEMVIFVRPLTWWEGMKE